MNKLALFVLLALPACATPEHNAQYRVALLSQMEAECTSGGTAPGTQDYQDCVKQRAERDGYPMTGDGQLAPLVHPFTLEHGIVHSPDVGTDSASQAYRH